MSYNNNRRSGDPKKEEVNYYTCIGILRARSANENDPLTVKEFSNGGGVINANVKISEFRQTGDGSMKETKVSLPVSIKANRAISMQQLYSLQSGMMVKMGGRIITETYRTRNGETKYSLVLEPRYVEIRQGFSGYAGPQQQFGPQGQFMPPQGQYPAQAPAPQYPPQGQYAPQNPYPVQGGQYQPQNPYPPQNPPYPPKGNQYPAQNQGGQYPAQGNRYPAQQPPQGAYAPQGRQPQQQRPPQNQNPYAGQAQQQNNVPGQQAPQYPPVPQQAQAPAIEDIEDLPEGL